MPLPELEEFRREVALLRDDQAIRAVRRADGRYALSSLSIDDVARLLHHEPSYYLLLAATSLNRTSLRRATQEEEAQLVSPRQRRAFAVRTRLPVSADFDAVVANAITLRMGDLQRKARGKTEQVFRERLEGEGIPLFMSPPRRVVPGIVIAGRKPDGVWPDPATGEPPVIYLEIKRIRRVADDIQKRLYELAEASLEMKLLYGDAPLTGLGIGDNRDVRDESTALRLRQQVAGVRPTVVGLFLCPRAEAERYRLGAEALIDRIFFQEEIEDCIAFISQTINEHGAD
ncbi:hypothetical protein [Nocardioides acrostichi]|uniref:Uncharacterized protein n=1 Tax=Nocardioides acrostichi TaxID=2784339 RepID=A0A930YBI4_9ACTN|nr:hypothetical protein [Nocardioides acrostichi]MBF4162503.1 hypothetical protein [Nocardioides acrostichi]